MADMVISGIMDGFIMLFSPGWMHELGLITSDLINEFN